MANDGDLTMEIAKEIKVKDISQVHLKTCIAFSGMRKDFKYHDRVNIYRTIKHQ